jgi:hypothetical protein
MHQAKTITPNGLATPCNPLNGKFFTLPELQKIVGGYIEIVRPPSRSGAVLVINENGKLDGLPLNQTASWMWQEACDPGSPRAEDPIVGTVLLCHASQLLSDEDEDEDEDEAD